jgi:hypothetical protein
MAAATLTLWSQYCESPSTAPTHKKRTTWHNTNVHNLFLHIIPVVTFLSLAAAVGVLLHTKPASTRIYGPIFPYTSMFLISWNSLKVLTATCHAGLALSENTAWHTGARLETLAFSHRIPSFSSCKECRHCTIWGFQHSVNEFFALMGCYTALTGISLVTTNQCCITSQKSEPLNNVDCSHKDLAVSPTNNNHTNPYTKITRCHICASYCFLNQYTQHTILSAFLHIRLWPRHKKELHTHTAEIVNSY